MFELIVWVLSPILSLIVALATVLFDRWLSERKECRRLLESLSFETDENIALIHNNISIMEQHVNSLKKEAKIMLEPIIPLSDLAWLSIKNSGYINKIGNGITRKLSSAYFSIDMYNNVIRWYELQKTRTRSQFHINCLEYLIDFSSEVVLPDLEEIKKCRS